MQRTKSTLFHSCGIKFILQSVTNSLHRTSSRHDDARSFWESISWDGSDAIDPFTQFVFLPAERAEPATPHRFHVSGMCGGLRCFATCGAEGAHLPNT